MIARSAWLGLLFTLAGCATSETSETHASAAGAAGSASGGSGGGATLDGGPGSGSGGNAGGQSCAAITLEGDPIQLPADLIWVIDQSGSMSQETSYVQSQLNQFVKLIEQSGIDYRVVVIADQQGQNAICVPPPLSDGGCGDGPRLRTVDTRIWSDDALDKLLTEYPKYSDFLRKEAFKHVVIITDDDSALPASEFTEQLAKLLPVGQFSAYQVHGIYAWGTPTWYGCDGPFGQGAYYGSVYDQLVEQTGGARGIICQDDWSGVFGAISAAVTSGSQLPCQLALPEPDEGVLDPALVNVSYTPGSGATETIFKVLGPADCAGGNPPGGWHYDDELDPTKIVLCSETCERLAKDSSPRLDVRFGCKSEIKPPR